MRSIFQSLVLLFLLTSCAGYKLRSNQNPLAKADVHSIAVPVFINKTTLEKVSSVYTREIISALSKFKNLKITAGDIKNEDALMLGIITPKELSKRGKFIRTSSLMTEDQQDAIGKRNAFEVPTSGGYELNVEIIVLKNPTREEIDFFTGYYNFNASDFPRTVFHHTFSISGSYSIENPVGDLASGAPLRGVQNQGKLRKSIVDSGKTLATDFHEVITNAF
ncbi:hypothetical protein [Bacteriovorax sp. Seq25_V]|uniref:hypothetical protein n=1 Tax=Bacteriovorax sp. Seq25_V TaxID=1201288 RepID=UPI0012F759EC|nr:hypothetical protein [Bacteriovorax sp. Seq25_V]